MAVPWPANAPVARLEPIVGETGPRVLAASTEALDTAVELVLSSPSKPRLVVFDHHPEADEERERFEAARRRLAEAGLTAVDSLAAVTGRGRGLPTVPLFQPDTDEDPMRLLLYTSGSTGTPKGAIYTERMLHRFWAGLMPTPADTPSVGITFMPMNHVVGRVNLYSALSRGGVSYFTAQSDMSSLFEDMGLVRPTELLLVPRIVRACRRRPSPADDSSAGSSGSVAMRVLRLEHRQHVVERNVGGVTHIETIERLPDIGRRPVLPQWMKVDQVRIVPEGVERLFGLPFNEKQNLPWRKVTGYVVTETAKRHHSTAILRSYFGQTTEIRKVLLHVGHVKHIQSVKLLLRIRTHCK